MPQARHGGFADHEAAQYAHEQVLVNIRLGHVTQLETAHALEGVIGGDFPVTVGIGVRSGAGLLRPAMVQEDHCLREVIGESGRRALADTMQRHRGEI